MPTSRPIRLLLLTLAIVLAGCASGGAGSVAPSPTSQGGSVATEDTGASFTGELAGDPTLEGGCLWLEADGQRYELQLPAGYTADASVTEISTPDGTTFAAGDALKVTGIVREDLATICQVGPVIEVSQITAA